MMYFCTAAPGKRGTARREGTLGSGFAKELFWPEGNE